jgi:hypothetical protein
MKKLPQWKPGWKVLWGQSREVRVSVVAIPETEYPVREVVVRRKGFGPFAVFQSHFHACRFAWTGNLIVPCAYLPSSYRCVWNEHGGSVKLVELPPGTRLARAVFCFE